METDAVSQQVQQKPEPVDSADLVVGVIAEFDEATLTLLLGSLRAFPGNLRIAILHNSPAAASIPTDAEAIAADSAAAPNNSSVFLLPLNLSRPDNAAIGGVQGMAAMYRSIFAAGEKLQARACCIIASKIESAPSTWVHQLAQPLLERNLDLVLPHYARRKFQGLLNNSVIAPLIRSLYGKRISNPMGPDLGLSRQLWQKMLGSERTLRIDSNALHPLASLAPAALCGNLQVGEVHLGARVYPPIDWTNLSSLLAEVLGPVFLDMERNAPCWQRTRLLSPVPVFGTPAFGNQDAGTLDASRLFESFQLGNRELQEVWGLVLPPSTLFELRKLSYLPPEQFRMPDELWVRIVYDFAIAHRLRTINRDHLLRSMTPLYLGWVASYAHDMQTAGTTLLERRLERLYVAFESGKPYLVSRWRWPDRFNP